MRQMVSYSFGEEEDEVDLEINVVWEVSYGGE